MRTSTFLQWAFLFVAATSPSIGQEPAQPIPAPSQPAPIVVPPQSPAPPAQTAPSVPPKKLPFFLILGTVFNEEGLAFPGVEVRVRRKEEKKFRWESATNSRGEFAVRIPDGYDYHVVLRAKRYQDEPREITTKIGEAQQQVTVRMQRIPHEKAGAKR